MVVGGVLASLNYGLEYAEGELTWLGMVQKIVQSTVVAGASAALITGMIVGLSLMFPFAIPVLLPVIFALQMVSIIFLGPLLLDLAKDWWEVLNGQNLLDASTTILQKAARVLEDVSKTVHNSYTKAKNSTWRGLSVWANWLARLVGLDRAMRMARNNLRQLGLDTWFNWLAYQSQWMTEQTSLISSSIAWWGYNSAIAVRRAAMGNSIATVVTTQFQNAISTTDGLLRSIEQYGSSAQRNVSQGLLALQPHQRWLQ